MLQVLAPRRGFHAYHCDPASFTLTPDRPSDDYRDETIAYYQTASYLYRSGGYSALSPGEQAAWAREFSGRAGPPAPAATAPEGRTVVGE